MLRSHGVLFHSQEPKLFHIYRAAWYLLLPLGALWHLIFIWRRPEFRQGFWQRYGWVPKHTNNPLVIHASSVGEVNAIANLVKRLLAETTIPILITTTTPTGRDRAQVLFNDVSLGARAQVQHCFLPFDMGIAMRLFLHRVKPRGILLVETELWPTLLRLCGKQNSKTTSQPNTLICPVWLINGRLSQRSAKRYKKFSSITQNILFGLEKLLVQDQETARRFAYIGADAERVQVMGSVKFDLTLPDNTNPALAESWLHPQDVCWVAGSTRGSEETMLLHAWRKMQSIDQGLLILVPRHPRRFDVVADLCEQSGLAWGVYSQTDAKAFSQQQGRRVLLVDAMGFLIDFYRVADAVFVGGSLVQKGGHNPLEPAALGKPVLMGPYNFNFSTICEWLEKAGALRLVSATNLVQEMSHVLSDKALQQSMGNAGQQLIAQHNGATEAYGSLIKTRFTDTSSDNNSSSTVISVLSKAMHS